MNKYTVKEMIEVDFSEIKKRVLDSGINEGDFREECYRNNPKYNRPNRGIENLIRQIYHSSSSFFEEADSDK